MKDVSFLLLLLSYPLSALIHPQKVQGEGVKSRVPVKSNAGIYHAVPLIWVEKITSS